MPSPYYPYMSLTPRPSLKKKKKRLIAGYFFSLSPRPSLKKKKKNSWSQVTLQGAMVPLPNGGGGVGTPMDGYWCST